VRSEMEAAEVYVDNFVLLEYGTGRDLRLPAHDQRDLGFVKIRVSAIHGGCPPGGTSIRSRSSSQTSLRRRRQNDQSRFLYGMSNTPQAKEESTKRTGRRVAR